MEENNEANLVLNQLAQNFAQKIAQLEGEKAILQVQVQKLSEELKASKEPEQEG